MTTTNIKPAVAEFLRRAKEQNAKPEGCDYPALYADIALTHRVNVDLLKEGVRRETVMPPN